MPQRVSLSEGLGVDEAVVLGVCPDPEPMYATLTRKAKSAVVEPDPGAVQLAAAEKLELQ